MLRMEPGMVFSVLGKFPSVIIFEMIIHSPELKLKNDYAIISSQIEFETTKFPFPKELWFRFPKEYEDYILPRGDAFLVGMIIPAMVVGEDIKINAPVSPKLINGLIEYQKILQMKIN